MHRHDRCSADDLYFGVVQGHACHLALFILLCKMLYYSTLETFAFFGGRMGRSHSRGECKLPFKIVLIHFVKKSLFTVLY